VDDPTVDADGTDDAEIRAPSPSAIRISSRHGGRALSMERAIASKLHSTISAPRPPRFGPVAGDDDVLLTPKQLAQWLGVSDQWVSISRCKGYGPPFVKVAPMTVRYHRGAVRKWLNERSFVSTAGYIQAEATAACARPLQDLER
jgi:hypothetical protein